MGLAAPMVEMSNPPGIQRRGEPFKSIALATPGPDLGMIAGQNGESTISQGKTSLWPGFAPHYFAPIS
jgi:hypothetical protein